MNSDRPSPGETADTTPQGPPRVFYAPQPVAWVVLSISLLASAGGWLIAWKHARLEARKNFDEATMAITAALRERMQVYQNVLHGAAGLFAASQSVERSEWRKYVQSVSIEQRFPGIDAVGYVASVRRSELLAFLERTRADGAPDFAVKEPGTNDPLLVVKYIEPEAEHQVIVGWNMGVDPERLGVAQMARDSGRIALSGQIMIRDEVRDPQLGCLMMLPVYRHELATDTPEQRRQALEGWVFARFVMGQLMTRVMDKGDFGLQVRIFDLGSNSEEHLIFDNTPGLTAARTGQSPWFEAEIPTSFGSRTWSVAFATKPSFEAEMRFGLSGWVAGGGAVISFLLFGIAWSLSHTRERALAIAANMTGTLRETNEQLQTEIEEREQSNRRIAMQYAVTRVLADAATLPEATSKIIRAVGENLNWDVGALWQVNAQTQRLHCVEFWSRPGIIVEEFETATRQRYFMTGEGLPGRVWGRSKPAWITDVVRDNNFPRAPFAEKAGLHGAFGFPILMGEELLGVMEFFSRKITQPDENLVSMMSAVGSQVGQFIERKRSEVALKHSEAIYHSLVESLPLSITRKDLQGRFIFANQRFCSRSGIALADLIGKMEADIYPPELAGLREMHDKQAIEKAATVETVEERQGPDGAKRYVQAIRTPLYDDNKNMVGLLGIFWDVTDRRRAEAELEHERFLLRTLMDNLPDRIYFKDARSRFIRDNRAHQKRLGVDTPHAIIGKTDFDFMAAETAQRTFQDEQEVIRTGEPINKEEKTTSTDGRTSWALITKMPLRDESGKVIGTFGISRDITDRKSAEEAMRAAKETAEEASRAKSQFLASMSHELRTPLNSVIGFANILLKNKAGNLAQAELNFLDRILANGKHLLTLINQILDLSKIEARKLELQSAPLVLSDLVRDTVAQQESLVRDKPVRLAVDLPGQVAPISADGEKLKQVIINLIGNALKFTEQGSVTVRVVTDPESHVPTRLEVVDTGIGIPADKLGVIFQAFQQAEAGTARKYGGTGLGLTISQALCQLMGYRIEVKSEVGKGSTFSVCLTTGRDVPAPSTPARAPKPSPSPMSPELKGKLVLVIDDELDSRTLLSHMIEEFGCQAITANSGEQGLHMAREFRPNLITVDLMMPHLDGWQVIRALKADPELRDIPVVVVSIVAGENRGGLIGAVDVLQKPVIREDLLAALRRTLPFQQPRILIVDDEADARQVLAGYLQDETCECRQARNGREALEIMEKFMPDLILLDLMMPEMDGLSFLSRIRTEPRYQWIPVVVVTAKDLTITEAEQLRHTAQEVIKKGDVFEADLRSVLRRLLQTQAAPKQLKK